MLERPLKPQSSVYLQYTHTHTHIHTHTHEHVTNNHIRTRSLLFLPLQTEQILTVQLKEQRLITYTNSPGTAVARWLRRFATNRKAAGSIQVSVT